MSKPKLIKYICVLTSKISHEERRFVNCAPHVIHYGGRAKKTVASNWPKARPLYDWSNDRAVIFCKRLSKRHGDKARVHVHDRLTQQGHLEKISSRHAASV